MTRNTNFSDFFENYVSVGFVAAVIVVIIVGLLSPLIFDSEVSRLKKIKNFYAALTGEQVADSVAYKAAIIVKQMTDNDSILGHYYQDRQHLLNLIDSLQTSIDSNPVLVEILSNPKAVNKTLGEIKSAFANDKLFSRYFWYRAELIDLDYQTTFKNLLNNKKDLIIGIVRGDSTAPVINIPSWGSFWKGYGIFTYCLIIFASLASLIYFLVDRRESLLVWPWQQFWPYPTILVMLPVLLPCVLAEVFFRLIFFHFSLRGAGSVIRRGYNISISDDRIIIKKKEAEAQIQEIQQKAEQVKEKFIKHCLISLRDKLRQLEIDVLNRREVLSDLGQAISKAQQDLASAQKEFDKWQKNFQQCKRKEAVNYGLDFERLLRLEKVRAVDLRDDNLYIYTDIIYIQRGLKKFEIGMFIIMIDLNSYRIRLENLSSTHPSGNFHPYAPRGRFCWGALHDSIVNALNNREYAVAVEFILQALQSYRGDNEGAVSDWMEVKNG